MKKIMITLALALSCIAAIAQNDEHEPGIYAVCGDEYVPLTFTRGYTSTSATGILGMEVEKSKIMFKESTSDTKAYGKFVLVCDMSKKAITKGIKKCDVFVKSMTPANMLIVPLQVFKDKKRSYFQGKSVNGINTTRREFFEFTWEMITDNSYEINCNLEPGEYGIVFRDAKLAPYDFTTIFDFTVPEGLYVPAGEEAEEVAE